MKEIKSFSDFCVSLRDSGFSMGGANDEGIFSLSSYFSNHIHWHTENSETDLWEWRIRILDEYDDIAYAKLFFNKSGYIRKEWYPYFLAARRNGKSFIEDYGDGTISSFGKRIYEIVSENKVMPLHIIKQLGGFSKEDKSKFDKAITELQMKM